MLNLDEIKARMANIPAGVWYQGGETYYENPGFADSSPVDEFNGVDIFDDDDRLVAVAVIDENCRVGGFTLADFIAHARADVPALAAEVERLRAECDKYHALCSEMSEVLESNTFAFQDEETWFTWRNVLRANLEEEQNNDTHL
jgi:hypothetical protein